MAIGAALSELSRHSREGGNPVLVFKSGSRLRDWIPAFAGMTFLCRGVAPLALACIPEQPQQQREIERVRRSQGLDIRGSMFARRLQVLRCVAAFPDDGRVLQPEAEQGVGHDPRVAAVAGGEGVDLHQPMVKAQRQFQRGIDRVIGPVACVVERLRSCIAI